MAVRPQRRATADKPVDAGSVAGRSHLPRAAYRPLSARVVGLPGARLVDRAERRWLTGRLPFPLDPPSEWDLLRRGAWLELARVVPGVTGREAAAQNLDLVIGICQDLDIRYVTVPEPNVAHHRIVIDEARWADFVVALRRSGQQAPLYVGVDAVTRQGRRQRSVDLTTAPRIADTLDVQTSLEVFRPVTPARGVTAFGRDRACIVERWLPGEDGKLRAPTRNARAEYVSQSLLTVTETTQDGRALPTLDLFTRRHVFDVDFPIDAVYLWVDGADPDWLARKKAAVDAAGEQWNEPDAVTDARFRDGGELRYSFRSLRQFAPWIRHVYLVTDRQVPSWLDVEHPDITVVDHRELFGDAGTLPTFNSHAIGARLHHIDGLAEHYLYFNDDVFLGRDVTPSLFFDANGISRFFVSRTSLGFSDAQHRMSHESARRNVADLIERDFGRTPTNVFFHAPIPQRRSTMTELEERYPEEFRRTLANQFRSHSDIEPNSWLHNYYGYLTGRAMPGRIRYSYFAVGDPLAEQAMQRLFAARDRDTFCLNDHLDATAEQHAEASTWLARYFPQPSGFELAGGPESADDRR